MRRLGWVALALTATSTARADPATTVEPVNVDPVDVTRRLAALEAENRAQADELEALRERQAEHGDDLARLAPLPGRLSGYIDVGFFAVSGDGSGIRTDLGHRYFPRYDGVVPDSWVFVGDPLSTAINARGEPASTADSRAVTFGGIGEGGAPTFLVNAVNLALFRGVGEQLTINASVDFVPRGRNVSEPDGVFLGDFVDVKLAYVEYRPRLAATRLSLFAGKFDSVLGFEYRRQDAPDRLAVTPSLICRYTCGHPLGLKARAELLGHALAINLAVTNGSHAIEQFPVHGETDGNQAKTVAGRVSYRLPVGAAFELGASAAVGAQDLQPDDGVLQWHAGADLHVDWHDLVLTAELVRGRARGRSEAGRPPCGVAPCLRYTGGYAELGYRASNALTPYARLDWRDAVHQHGASFVYVSAVARATLGLHVELGTQTIAKLEYTFNRELGIPQFPDDVLTSALVVKY